MPRPEESKPEILESRRQPAPPTFPADSLLSAIVDSSDDAIISKDINGIITSWNRAAEHIFGYTSDEMVGRSITVLLPKDRESEEAGIIARIKMGQRVDHFETTRQHKNGELIDVSVTVSPIRAENGQVIGASNIARNIGDRKRHDRISLLLALIVNSSDDAIVSKNLDGIITSWNAGAQRIFGYTPDEAIGRSILMVIPRDRQAEETNILARLARGERVDHFETMRVRKNGELFPVSLTISPIRNSEGIVIGASKIARDITELKKITVEREQLLISERAARTAAEHANRTKDEFLATVSHELRTPLNAIVGWTQVLRDSNGSREEIAHGIDVIERNAKVQAQLIDDLLDLSRISSGKMTLDVEWVEIGLILQDAIAAVRQAAELKRIAIKTVVHELRGGMMGDKRRLQQVLWNLLSNAIKFTPSGGRILVTVARVNSHVEISVSDNGRGISADFLPHVFERFRQADATTTRRQGGLGIGLALVKELVEMHGGDVRAESPGLGQGATFVVSLPVIIARGENPPVSTVSPAPDTTVGAPIEELLTGIRVLAVDDDQDSLDVIKRILTVRQAEVQTALSVNEAIRLFQSFRPDVILSDIGMPEQDGFDLVRKLRTLPGAASIPAAALTALARSEDRMRALKAGFQTHVAKPVAPGELVAVVRSLAGLRDRRI